MAEAAVSLVIDKLGDLLIQQTIQKIVFLKNVPAEIERLKTLLIGMQCFLKYADEQQDDDPRIRNWVSEIRDAAYESEDVIETFFVKMESLKKKGFLKRMSCFPKRLLCLYNVGQKIKSIQEKMFDIENSRQTFGIKNLGEGTSTRGEELRKLLRSSPFMEDQDLVGLEEKTSSLVAQLLVQDSRRRVTSIVGMAGVGKTTLARKVYNHVDVTGHFDCRAWVYVSQKFSLREVLGGIIKQVEKQTRESLEMLERMQEPDLETMLREKLQDKCFLVVLDDIWEAEAWDCLAGAFPDVNNGSRLLLTSRYENVPQHADALSIPYKLKTLGEEDGWQLFLKKAFVHGANSGSKLSSELEGIGRKIVERCDGLPLAITVIGSLLQGKRKLESEWQSVLATITSHWSSGRKGVSAILALSFNDLPIELKTCFLYFSFFPEDSEIPTRKLFHLWIAEGLIHQKGAEVLEDVAADRLDKLINRNLVQVVAVTARGMVKSCQVHDLLRELAIAKAEEEIFLEIYGVSSSYPSSKCRHLVVHCRSERYNYPGEFGHSAPHLRSFIFFNLAEFEQEVNLSFTSLKLLRVLDLENMNVTYLPEEIGEFSLLRYLGLRNTRIKRLPLSLSCLQSLQTLDIRMFHSVEVPNVLWKLKNLQHIYISATNQGVQLKFDTLKNLQTLCGVDLDSLIDNKLMLLTNLEKLDLWVRGSSRIDELFSSICKLENLVSVTLRCSERPCFPSLNGLEHLSHVRRLKLAGTLTKLPIPHNFPPRLSHLSLCGLELEENPIPILEKLEHLSILKLKTANVGTELVISQNGFKNLKFLELSGLTDLVKISIGRGSSEIRHLRFSNCYFLAMLPEELKFMKALERLELVDMPKGFINRLQGIDSFKVSHVPNIIVRGILDSHMLRVKLLARRAAELFARTG